jgi:hypothetical protein
LFGGAAAGATAGITAAWRKARHRQPGPNRWLLVTVNKPAGDIDAVGLPEPLGELGDRIETLVEPAAGGKGIVLAARLRRPGPSGKTARLAGKDPRQEVRLALRRAKSLLETGDVLLPDAPATHPGPRGKLVALASRRAGGEGQL